MRRRTLLVPAWAGVALLGLLSALLYRWMERSGEFDLAKVCVYGCRTCDSAAVSTALRPFLGTPLGRVDLREIRDAVEVVPGMESAIAWRSWPDGLGVDIHPSRPVLLLSRGGWRSAVSDRGRNLPDSFISDTLPLFEVGGSPDPGVLRRIVIWASEGIPRGVDSFRVEGRCLEAVVGSRTLLLGDRGFSERLAKYSEALESGCLGSDWNQVDLRYEGQVVLRRSCGQGVSS